MVAEWLVDKVKVEEDELDWREWSTGDIVGSKSLKIIIAAPFHEAVDPVL